MDNLTFIILCIVAWIAGTLWAKWEMRRRIKEGERRYQSEQFLREFRKQQIEGVSSGPPSGRRPLARRLTSCAPLMSVSHSSASIGPIGILIDGDSKATTLDHGTNCRLVLAP